MVEKSLALFVITIIPSIIGTFALYMLKWSGIINGFLPSVGIVHVFMAVFAVFLLISLIFNAIKKGLSI